MERQVPWYESNLLWGPVGLVVALILTAVSGMVALLWLVWFVSWITVWAVTKRIAQSKCEPAYFVLGIIVFGLLLYGIRVGFEAQLPAGPQLAVDSVDDPLNVIPQIGQPVPPKVSKFARIKVTNLGERSIANVKAMVIKLDDRECRFQLPLASNDTLFSFPTPSPVVVSANLNPGDDQYFEVLVECNGAVCPSGELAVPEVAGGHRVFVAEYDGKKMSLRPKQVTVRVSGDEVRAMTKTFAVVLAPDGRLLLHG